MPEGPEIHIACRLINLVSANRIFTGPVFKSEVSTKNPDIPWSDADYTLQATSRGKELRVTLNSVHTKNVVDEKLEILFRFGMSGQFRFDKVDNLKKHAHLRFFTKDKSHALCFVDSRRFGKWQITSDWGKNRGPCIIREYS